MVGSSPVAASVTQPAIDFATSAASLSPPVMLAIALLAFLRGWVVLPREIERRDAQIAQVEQERDEYKAMTFRLLDVGEHLTSLTEERKAKK